MDDVNKVAGEETTQTPNAQTPEPTFTKSQVEAEVRKAKNDTLSDYKRLEAELKRSTSVADSALKRLKAIEESQLKAEEEAVKDDPIKFSALQMKREAARLRAEAEDKESTLKVREAEISTQVEEIREARAEKLAEKYGLDQNLIMEYGGQTKDSMEKFAKSIGKPQGESAKRETEPPDSGKTKGNSGGLTIEQVKKMTPEEVVKHYSEISKLPLSM